MRKSPFLQGGGGSLTLARRTALSFCQNILNISKIKSNCQIFCSKSRICQTISAFDLTFSEYSDNSIFRQFRSFRYIVR